MPRGDGTGPNGQGPLTGRGMGYCAGYSTPGFMSQGFGGGMAFRRGFGRGKGRGFRWRANVMPIQPQIEPQVIPIQQIPVQQIPVQQIQPQITAEQEKKFLQEELIALKQEMQEIETRLKELSKKKE